MFATTLGGRGSWGAIFCDRKAKLVGRAMLRCSLCPACAPPAPGAALLGTARSWRAIVPFTHLAREGRIHHRTAGIVGRTRAIRQPFPPDCVRRIISGADNEAAIQNISGLRQGPAGASGAS